MDRDRSLIATGIVGAIVAAVCCATPLLAVLFGALGMTAWFANAGYVVLLAVVIGLGLLAVAFTRKRRAQR